MTRDRQHRWAIVLAGGEGERLKPYVRECYGTDRPKQFCSFAGRHTLVEETVLRAETALDPEQILVVGTEHHLHYLLECLGHRPPGTLLIQPEGRGTALGVLLPLLHILHRDPEATVVLLPSDHFVRPHDGLTEALEDAELFLASDANEHVILLAAEPTTPEPDYGWIKRGLKQTRVGRQVFESVAGFMEKPSREQACRLLEDGWLWNTGMLVGRAAVLLQVMCAGLPELTACTMLLRRFIGTDWEHAITTEIYRTVPSLNFSTAVLSRQTHRLALLPLTQISWSDWGTKERILQTLSQHPELPRPYRAPSLVAHRQEAAARS
ncbi:MAG: sugar phosphate nucleotidyltransferase [Nitrospiraceae bacterium]